MANSHITNRIDFKHVVASVLRLITDVGLYKDLTPFIIPSLFYSSDKSDNVESLRSILTLMKDLNTDGQSENFTIPYIDSQINIKIKDEEKSKIVKSCFNNWTRDDVIKQKMNDDGCFKSFIDYIKALQIYDISIDFGRNLQENKVNEAVVLMQQALQRISKIGSKDRETIEEGELYSLISSYANQEKKNDSLMIGNPLLDEILGGFESQTLNVFIAKEGTGKTMLAHHLIAQAIEQGVYVWVGAVEDRKKSFTYRIMSRLTGIPIRRLKNEFFQLVDEEKEKLKEADALFNKYVKVEFMYGVGVADVHKAALDWDLSCRLRNKPIHKVNIVDYTGHIMSNSKGEKGFEKMRTAYGERKDFALKNNKICFDFAQINREGSKNLKNNHMLTQNDLAGGYDIAQVIDNLISINRNDDDKLVNTTKFHICKARDSGDSSTIQVKVDFRKAKYIMNDWDLIHGPVEVMELNKEIKARRGEI